MVNCMLPYSIASLTLEILCLKYALNDSLGCKNPRDALKGKNHAKNRGEWVSTMLCAYVGLGLRMQI